MTPHPIDGTVGSTDVGTNGPSLAAYVISKNEARFIERCVQSLLRVTDHVLVLDSGSTDNTVAIAERAGAVVRTRAFDGFAHQRNAALEIIRQEFDSTHVVTLDADEYFDELATEEILRLFETGGNFDVAYFPRDVEFMGRLLRYGTRRDVRLARLFRTSFDYEQRQVNEHLAIPESAVLREVSGAIVHDDELDWRTLIEKHNDYSSIEAEIRFAKNARERVPLSAAVAHRHLRNRYLRQQIFERLPAKPLMLFLYQYVMRLGLLDGRPGFDRIVLDCINEYMIDRKSTELARRL